MRVSKTRFAVSMVMILLIFASRFVYNVVIIARYDLALDFVPVPTSLFLFSFLFIEVNLIAHRAHGRWTS